MRLGFSKASSSGDVTKNLKNGGSSKAITNGMDRLSMNTTCSSLKCCAMRICAEHQSQYVAAGSSGSSYVSGSTAAGSGSSTSSSGYNSNDYSEESLQNGSNANLNYNSSSSYASGYGSTGRGGVRNPYSASPWATTNEPVWYMCDDDKIKAMSQKEFEELLSPARKITITPYLLFYARFDLQPNSRTYSNAKTTTTATRAAAAAKLYN